MDHNEAASDPEEGLDVTLSGMLDHRTTARGPCIVLCMVHNRTHKALFLCIFILSCIVPLYLSFSMFNYVCVWMLCLKTMLLTILKRIETEL